MNSIRLKCRAKINLAIDVLGRREDNYHLVEMIMQSIDLYDYIEIEEIDKGILIESNCPNVPLDSSNIVYKGANLIKDRFGINKGVKIKIEKNIPVAAGMAGGSSNGAAVLIGLNKIWSLNLSENELMEIGLKLGADVPFCIKGGAALAQGIGEKLTYIKGLNDVDIIICKPDISVSTAMVYKNFDMSKIRKRPNIDLLLKCLEEENIEDLCMNMENVLESVTEKKYSEISNIKEQMKKCGAIGTMMSGSGPTVFGIFKDLKKGKDALAKLSDLYNQTYLVKSAERGIEIDG